MEHTRQFQDRVVRYTSRWLGWVYDVGLRRLIDGTQVLFDADEFEIEARSVVPVMDAVRVEQEAMAFRDGLKSQ